LQTWKNLADSQYRFNANQNTVDRQAQQATIYAQKFKTFSEIKFNHLIGKAQLASVTLQMQDLITLLNNNVDLFFDTRAP